MGPKQHTYATTCWTTSGQRTPSARHAYRRKRATISPTRDPAFCSSGSAHNAHPIIRPSTESSRRITALTGHCVITGSNVSDRGTSTETALVEDLHPGRRRVEIGHREGHRCALHIGPHLCCRVWDGERWLQLLRERSLARPRGVPRAGEEDRHAGRRHRGQ